MVVRWDGPHHQARYEDVSGRRDREAVMGPFRHANRRADPPRVIASIKRHCFGHSHLLGVRERSRSNRRSPGAMGAERGNVCPWIGPNGQTLGCMDTSALRSGRHCSLTTRCQQRGPAGPGPRSFQRSRMVRQPAVNRRSEGSIPSAGAGVLSVCSVVVARSVWAGEEAVRFCPH
jgi:hypothetical protein